MKPMLLLLALCLLLSSCAAKPASASPSASPLMALTPSPAVTPSPTPEETDLDEYDEADYYFDFGQDDRIELSYEVHYPAERMEGWEVQRSTRVSALLTLQRSECTLTVLLEDAPEYASLEEFLAFARQMLTLTYEGVVLTEEEPVGDIRVLRGELNDGRTLLCGYRAVDGLYASAELMAGGEGAEEAQALFTEVFLPNLSFTYTQINTLSQDNEEE